MGGEQEVNDGRIEGLVFFNLPALSIHSIMSLIFCGILTARESLKIAQNPCKTHPR